MVLLNLATRKILSQCKNSAIFNNTFRSNSGRSSQLKVTICGAAGGVGQPLSLMLKQSPYIDQLALYDVRETGGLAGELNHIDTQCHVTAYNQSTTSKAFEGSSLVVIVARSHTLPNPDMAKVFLANAPVVKEIVQNAAKHCPKALLAIASAPIEGMVPLATEILKLKGVHNPKAVFGINSLNTVRSNSFAAETLGIEPECVVVPVVGGSFGEAIIPVLSQTKPCGDFTDEEIELLTAAIQNAESGVVKAKGNQGGQLANAFAIARFVVSLVKAVKGHEGIVEHAMIASPAHPLVKYLTVPISLGPGGVKKDLGLPNMSSYEHCMLDRAVPILLEYNQKARAFLGIKDSNICDPCDSSPRSPICPPDWCEKQGKEKSN